MNFDKLIDFLSAQHKGFLVSFAVLLPVFYTLLYLYVDSYGTFDFADRLVFAGATDVLYHAIFYTALFVADIKAHDKNLMSQAVLIGCFSAILCIVISLVFNIWHFWLPVLYVASSLFGIASAYYVVGKNPKKDGDD